MKTVEALRYHQFGKPDDVLTLDEIPLPKIGPGEVLIRLLASPINPSDIGSILGVYGNLPELPAVAGLEGTAEIVEIGDAVDELQPGQWVRFPEQGGVWQEACVVDAANLEVLPENLPLETACMAFVNAPTAILLLDESRRLREGDWIIQNGANSNLGIAVIQYARKRGLRTLNVVRRESLKEPLESLGADVVVTEDQPYAKETDALTGGGEIRLALNSIGGRSALGILDALANGGVHVTIGAMDFTPIRFPTRQLIFNGIQLRGFWLNEWKRTHSPAAVREIQERVLALMAEGTFRFPIESKYPLSRFEEALAHHFQPRFGKILLIPS